MLSEIQNKQNKVVLFDLIKNHFCYNKASLNKLKRMIKKPYFDPVYKSLGLDKYGRKYFPIDYNAFRENDNAWVLFKRYFSMFCVSLNVSYKNFLDGYAIIEKNQYKILKALIAFYSDEKQKDYLLLNNDVIRWNYFKYNSNLERAIREAWEVIAENKKSKKQLYVVLSLNYSDWFLCSTGESWTSCLNLYGDGGTYWISIPSIFADKNKCLIYITDGQQKTVFGLTKERFINRTFGFLDESNNLYLVRHYPNSTYESINYKKLFNYPYGVRDLNNYTHGVYGKHTVEPLITSFSKNSKVVSFPYLDSHNYEVDEYNDDCLILKSDDDSRQKCFSVFYNKDKSFSLVDDNDEIRLSRSNTNFASIVKKEVSLRYLKYRKLCSVCEDGLPSSRLKDDLKNSYCRDCYEKLNECEKCRIKISGIKCQICLEEENKVEAS